MSTSQHESSVSEEHAAPPEAWDAIAEGYDRYVAPQEVDLANDALRLVGLESGERFLDVAAGTGGLSLPAARLGAEVLATDWSPVMIERFVARAREEGLSKAEGRVMDCHSLDLPDDTFDVTGSQFGVMLVPDQARALREMVRVTKPGGRVLVIAYGSPAELEFLQFFISALKAVAPEFAGLPDDPPPLEFQVADPEVLRQRLTEAGLKDVRVERTAERPAFVSGQEMWDWVLYGNPIPGMLLANLSEDHARVSARSSLECSASAPTLTGEPCSRTRSTSALGGSEARRTRSEACEGTIRIDPEPVAVAASGGDGDEDEYCRGMADELEGNERVRTAELIAALCLATDLGMAFPFEHGLQTTLIAMRLAGKLGVDRENASRDLLRLPAFPRRLHHRGPWSPRRSSAGR